MALPTPLYNLSKYAEVYEPSEDTFLFLDALEADIEFLQLLQPQMAVEIGSGSGVVITALSYILKKNCEYFATDINPQACKATLQTAQLNNVEVESLNMNLLQNFKSSMFDVILFNPPYVVTDSKEITLGGINRAWAGGLHGRETIDQVLCNLPYWLSKNGVCYMVLLKENKPKEVVNIMRDKFNCEIVLERKIPGEHLFVYKFYKVGN